MQVDIDHVLAATAEVFGGNELLKQMCDNLPTQCQLLLAAVLVQMQCTGAFTECAHQHSLHPTSWIAPRSVPLAVHPWPLHNNHLFRDSVESMLPWQLAADDPNSVLGVCSTVLGAAMLEGCAKPNI